MYFAIPKLYNLFINHPDISTDSRNIKPDSLFFAIKGENFDGNRFAEEAINKGAAYSVVDDSSLAGRDKMILVSDALVALQQLAQHHRNTLKIPVIGITGSNGKTTTKELIRSVLSQKYNTFATSGNLNNHIGVPLSILSVGGNVEIAVIEMGANHRGEIDTLCKICTPGYGLITNIGKAHLEGFGGMKGVIEAKTELFNFIKKTDGKLFVNIDDKLLNDKSETISRITYGKETESDLQGCIAERFPFLTVNINFGGNNVCVQSNLIGSYNFTNMMAAACIGNYFGVDSDKIAKGLSSYHPTNNRSQWYQSGSNKIIIDAYNANPTSMELAIENFWDAPYKNKIVILGDMLELGNESREEHQKIIDLINDKKFHSVILVGSYFNNLTHNPEIRTFNNVAEALSGIGEMNLTGNTILLKGSRGIRLEKLLEVL